MKSLQKVLSRVAPWVIGITIGLGSTMVFPGLSYNYANSKSIVIEIGMALVIAIGLLIIPRSIFKHSSTSKIAITLGIFLLISILATCISIDPTLSWFSHLERGTGMFFVLLVSIGLLFSVLIATQTGTVRKAVLYPITIAAVVIALSTIFGFTGFNIIKSLILSDVASGGGLTGNSSYAGTYLMMAFFITLYLLVTTKDIWKKVGLVIAEVIIIFNPVIFGYGLLKGTEHGIINILGDARGATISLVLGLIFSFGVYLSFNGKKIFSWVGRILAVLVVAVTVVSITLLIVPNNPVHNFFSNEASDTRFLYWGTAIKSIHDHPILGTGPETFRHADEYYFNSNFMRKTYKREIWSDKPHNAYLEIVVTTGFVGGIAYLAFISALWISLYQYGKRKKEKNTIVFVSLFSGLLFAYLLNNLILFDVAISYLLFFLVVGIILVSERKEDVSHVEIIGSRETTVRALLGTVIVVTSLIIVIPQIVKLYRVLFEMYAPLEQRAGLYQKSENTSPYGADITISQRADVYTQNYLNHMNEVLASSETSHQLVLADVASLTAELQVAAQKYPQSAEGAIALARLGSIKISLLNKLDPDALQLMDTAARQAITLSPTNPQGYWLLAQTYTYEGKFDQALSVFNQALAINPKIPESYQYILELAKLTNNKKLYTQTMTSYTANIDRADL